jgi:hypothetical protein
MGDPVDPLGGFVDRLGGFVGRLGDFVGQWSFFGVGFVEVAILEITRKFDEERYLGILEVIVKHVVQHGT